MTEILGCQNSPTDYSNGELLFTKHKNSHLLLSNYNQFAVMADGKFTVVDEFGNVDVLDEHYRPLPDAKPATTRMLSVMDEMSRFYSK